MTYSPDQPTIVPSSSSPPQAARTERQSPLSPVETRDLGQPYLRVENIHKSFGKFVALRDIYLDVYPGEFVCLLGPSGCGKTTLLRIIAGLEQQTSGRVIQAGKDVSQLPPSKRDFGIVFQSYALFPNLTATQNIAYGLQNTKIAKEKINARVEELLETVSLGAMGHQYPAQLSGGQQQRVALARALALSPGLLLLDEPLSALDAQVRVKLRTEISELQKRLGITTVMVTHDQAEALAMADRIVVMDKGYIAQVGSPLTIYQRPHTPFVANFIGVMNFLPGVVTAPEQIRCGNLLLTATQNQANPDQQVTIAVRPEDIRVLNQGILDQGILDQESAPPNLPNVFAAEVERTEFLGSGYRVTLRPIGDSKEMLYCDVSTQEARRLDLMTNAVLTIQLPPNQIQVFAA